MAMFLPCPKASGGFSVIHPPRHPLRCLPTVLSAPHLSCLCLAGQPAPCCSSGLSEHPGTSHSRGKDFLLSGPSFPTLPWGPPRKWGNCPLCSQMPQSSWILLPPQALPGVWDRECPTWDTYATVFSLLPTILRVLFPFPQDLEFSLLQRTDGSSSSQPPRLKHFCVNVQKSSLFQ